MGEHVGVLLPDNPCAAYSPLRVRTGSSAFFVTRTLISSPCPGHPCLQYVRALDVGFFDQIDKRDLFNFGRGHVGRVGRDNLECTQGSGEFGFFEIKFNSVSWFCSNVSGNNQCLLGGRDLRFGLDNFQRGESADIDLLFVVAVELVCELKFCLSHVDVSAGKNKFPVGVATAVIEVIPAGRRSDRLSSYSVWQSGCMFVHEQSKTVE